MRSCVHNSDLSARRCISISLSETQDSSTLSCGTSTHWFSQRWAGWKAILALLLLCLGRSRLHTILCCCFYDVFNDLALSLSVVGAGSVILDFNDNVERASPRSSLIGKIVINVTRCCIIALAIALGVGRPIYAAWSARLAVKPVLWEAVVWSILVRSIATIDASCLLLVVITLALTPHIRAWSESVEVVRTYLWDYGSWDGANKADNQCSNCEWLHVVEKGLVQFSEMIFNNGVNWSKNLWMTCFSVHCIYIFVEVVNVFDQLRGRRYFLGAIYSDKTLSFR